MNDTERFVHQVRTYCEFVDSTHELDLDKRLATARRRLLALYSAALSLPSGVHRDEADVERQRPEEWPGFGEKDFYWEMFDPYVDEERVGASLSDDVLDVYDDVGRGLGYWDAGHRERAVWEWRFAFETHWGDHAIDALRALHRACGPSA